MPRCAAVNFLPLRRLLGPGGCGTTDELANPGNGLFGARKDVEPFGGLSVEPPSHDTIAAFSPALSERHRIQPIISGESSMPKAPIEDTMFQSAKATL